MGGKVTKGRTKHRLEATCPRRLVWHGDPEGNPHVFFEIEGTRRSVEAALVPFLSDEGRLCSCGTVLTVIRTTMNSGSNK